MMHEKYNAYRIFVKVGKHAVVKITDITEENVLFDSINDCEADFDEMVSKVNGVLNEHLAEEPLPYKLISTPLGYGN